MTQYEVAFKRVEVFYQKITVEASDQEGARQKAEQLSCDGGIEFDYFKESDILEEHIIYIEKL